MMAGNKKHEMQRAIMWDLRCMRSGFGSQVFSTKRSEPCGAFGTAHRDAFQKVRAERSDLCNHLKSNLLLQLRR